MSAEAPFSLILESRPCQKKYAQRVLPTRDWRESSPFNVREPTRAKVKRHDSMLANSNTSLQLHWLPVKQRALYKLALITSNVLQHNNPMYLRDLLTIHNPSRNLCSSSQNLLSVGYMRTASSSRCFKHSAAINWNDLPFDI